MVAIFLCGTTIFVLVSFGMFKGGAKGGRPGPGGQARGASGRNGDAKGARSGKRPLQRLWFGGPKDTELRLDAGEVFVAGGQGGLAVGGQGGGEAVGIGELVEGVDANKSRSLTPVRQKAGDRVRDDRRGKRSESQNPDPGRNRKGTALAGVKQKQIPHRRSPKGGRPGSG